MNTGYLADTVGVNVLYILMKLYILYIYVPSAKKILNRYAY